MTRSFAAMGGPDFLRLWSAQAVSAVGARITREGLPMAAVLVLGASPGQIGLLAALTRGPALGVGLMSGGLADRSRRRGLLIAMDVARAVLLATIPIAAWLHLLSIIQIYLTAAPVGAASVLFEIADHAYLPTLVARSALTEANARLNATEAGAGRRPVGHLGYFDRQSAPDLVAAGDPRVAATFQAVAGALGIVGALVDGALGGWIGPRETLMIACAGMLLGPLATAFSALRHYRAFARSHGRHQRGA